MSRGCLIIPVHPRKANWLISFLNSIRARRGAEAPPFEIVLATSNYEEFRLFNRLCAHPPLTGAKLICVQDYIESLGMRDFLIRYLENADNSIVNSKKFSALIWASRAGYDWVACLDSDTVAVSSLDNLLGVLIANYRSGLYFAGASDEGRFLDVNRHCRSFFSEAEQPALMSLTKDDSLYSWFFDVPFYWTLDLVRFLDFLAERQGSLEGFLTKLHWLSFEHILFQMWRCLQGESKLVDYTELGVHGVPETLRFHDLLRIQERYGYCPAWMQTEEFLVEPESVRALRNIELLCHFDRI